MMVNVINTTRLERSICALCIAVYLLCYKATNNQPTKSEPFRPLSLSPSFPLSLTSYLSPHANESRLPFNRQAAVTATLEPAAVTAASDDEDKSRCVCAVELPPVILCSDHEARENAVKLRTGQQQVCAY